jgi:succinoglycan biosynthesis protein ExoM
MNPSDRQSGRAAGAPVQATSAAVAQTAHIAVCVCTYKRPDLLMRLLKELDQQETADLFTFEVVIADNDAGQSAERVVDDFRTGSNIAVRYCVEPRQNIALARNKVVENAEGDYLAFIDDDEFPAHDWLLKLYIACTRYGVDGVLGPVLRHFDEKPPAWLEKSQFYVRRVNTTGMQVDWHEARTGNVLIKREILAGDTAPFRPEFRAGEDQDFFRRKIEEGRVFIWTADAKAFEVVPPARWSRAYLLRKALLRGATAALQPNCGFASIAKSVLAVALYSFGLPFALLFGQNHFMTLLVKLSDHLGKILMRMGINPIREQYVSE